MAVTAEVAGGAFFLFWVPKVVLRAFFFGAAFLTGAMSGEGRRTEGERARRSSVSEYDIGGEVGGGERGESSLPAADVSEGGGGEEEEVYFGEDILM